MNYLHVRYIIIILHYFHQDGDSAASIDLVIVEMIHSVQMKQAAEVSAVYLHLIWGHLSVHWRCVLLQDDQTNELTGKGILQPPRN